MKQTNIEENIVSKYTELSKLCTHAVEEIRKRDSVLVVSHVDADGLTSSAIACLALGRLGIDYQTLFFRQLDLDSLEKVSDMGVDLVIFTDLGSGLIKEISDRKIPAVIIDHHHPGTNEHVDVLAHVNPHVVGADGATQLSGSGTSFLLAQALAEPFGSNDDLSALAVVGAVGDLQDMANGQLVGLNRVILDVGSNAGVLSFGKDLKLFGRQTRPVFKMLEYSQDPYIPGLSGNEDACIAFLKDIGIRLGGEKRRRWIDLSQDEKTRLVSALIRKGLRNNIPGIKLERLVGEVYTLIREKEGTELRDASEYSTLLNATARYGHANIGLAVCMGDRSDALDEACVLLSQHRQNLVNGIKLVSAQGITRLKNVQYFDAGNAIQDTIVGIVAGMCFQIADRSIPILAFAATPTGDLKVSARGTQDLVRAGLDLAEVMRHAVSIVGGIGGGHNVAAGATIPAGKKNDFLDLVDAVVGRQLSRG